MVVGKEGGGGIPGSCIRKSLTPLGAGPSSSPGKGGSFSVNFFHQALSWAVRDGKRFCMGESFGISVWFLKKGSLRSRISLRPPDYREGEGGLKPLIVIYGNERYFYERGGNFHLQKEETLFELGLKSKRREGGGRRSRFCLW